ncbi:hypothetical protein ABL78_2106 [Leptomonas seymouri]|uniref:Uncharacterized protein n=1 Tax=Leptomonas seymouri TaxID=5684 RepID=A0A0N1PDL7_LEPSE|nr:hypothetical protein ABL78_2106 [Leptomonas seymouri]|eukprot:KPI88791.1 hypothetical protein ABL78_2106 [Leptomonas seymouri]
MMYKSLDHASEAEAGNASTAAATTSPQQQQQQLPPAQASAPAAHVVTTPINTPERAAAAKPAVAQDEPVLVGKVVSVESSAVRGAAPQSVNGGQGSAEDDEDTRSDTSASSSIATTNSFVGDVDRTELIFDFGRYVGQVDPITGLREGQGCLHYKSGNVYTGNWRDGAADGFGEKRYRNGDIYRGHWAQGKRSGRGAYLFSQGHFYDGMYANDKPEGYGIYTTLKGDRYAGQWKAGHKCGKGRETLVSGQVFVGTWRYGKKQGRGKLYLPGAESYIYGIWNDDKFFRELTEAEMGVDAKEDVVDEFGLPRNQSAPPVAPPWVKPASIGAAVTDRVMMGVTALEDRMESLGRAIERVMGVSNAEDAAQSNGTAAAVAGATSHSAAGASTSSHLLFASPHQQTAEGVLVNALADEEDEEELSAAGVETRRPANATPPAAVLSTAVKGEEQPVEISSTTPATAAATPAASVYAEREPGVGTPQNESVA